MGEYCPGNQSRGSKVADDRTYKSPVNCPPLTGDIRLDLRNKSSNCATGLDKGGLVNFPCQNTSSESKMSVHPLKS